jgi:hypothetical protein
MRRPEDDSPDPQVGRTLAVIDATLAGDAVEPEYAELAELTLILAGQRPAPSREFTETLDARMAGRFAGPPRERRGGGSGPPPRHARRRWLWAPGAMAGVAAAVAAVVALGSMDSLGGQGVSSAGSSTTASAAGAETATSSASAASTASSPPAAKSSPVARRRLGAPTLSPDSGHTSAPNAQRSASSSAGAALPSGGIGTAAGGGTSSAASVPTPQSNGRQIVQSAQLSLSTRPDQVDTVAQQVFDVIAAEKGYVQSSTVTATGSAAGYAQFQLTVPSANLQTTMTALSRMHGAAVVSRTDNSQDVTGDLGGAGRRLADARALRTSLLRRLAAATTTTAIDSLKAQIRDAEAAIASDLATLHGLHRKVDNTQISVTLNASMLPGHRNAGATGFTLRRAAHDAGRVLVVAAGVALIALAVLVPLGLLGLIGLWLGAVVRRRRREQALDLV